MLCPVCRVMTSTCRWHDGVVVIAVCRYLCSLHIPRCSVNASANATVNATSAVQPSRRGAQAGGSVLEAMPVDTCFHAHSVCGTQPSVARSLCHSCKGNRYCPLSATSLDNLTPPVPINATGSKSGQCLVPVRRRDVLCALDVARLSCLTLLSPTRATRVSSYQSSADVPFCTHVAGTSVFLRTDLYPTARVADKFARAVVAQSANGASTCLKAIKTLACATMLPPCTASAAKTSGASLAWKLW